MAFGRTANWLALTAGGCAGAASRTVVSPLERLKIIQCVILLLVDGFLYYSIYPLNSGHTDKFNRAAAMHNTEASGGVSLECTTKRASRDL